MPKNANTVHYVRFWFPGAFCAEDSSRRVKARDPALVKPPKGCFAFDFFDRTETRAGKEVLVGPERNRSGHFFVGGKVMTLGEIKREFPKESGLISNMERNNWGCVIRTRAGQFQPFTKDDRMVAVA